MPRNAAKASSGASLPRDSSLATPRAELTRIRDGKEREVSQVGSQIMEAMLTASGELGYRHVAVRHVLERYGGYRLQFYRHFESKAACYAAAYESEIARLERAVLDAAAAEHSWRDGLQAALDVLANFVAERPVLARGLLVEVHVAGGPALAKREEVFERLSRAIDSARRETESRHSPPPVTATFMIGAIDEAVAGSLVKGAPESFALAIPDLVRMAAVAYFGDGA